MNKTTNMLKNTLKLCIPHGIYEVLKKNNRKYEPQRNIIYRGILELIDTEKSLTELIGDDWKISPYYDIVENDLRLWWDENSIFYRRFQELDCRKIVELACGHGRHVQRYLSVPETIYLVDINQENINFCKNRYANETKIQYVVNDGTNFIVIDSSSQTAIFTYDAMIHFEMFDIIKYLKDANRILVNGGKILFHHSNAAYNPELFYRYKPLGRNFLSADIFAYVALRSGFKIISQDIFSWEWDKNDTKDIDCLSLCQKVKGI